MELLGGVEENSWVTINPFIQKNAKRKKELVARPASEQDMAALAAPEDADVRRMVAYDTPDNSEETSVSGGAAASKNSKMSGHTLI